MDRDRTTVEDRYARQSPEGSFWRWKSSQLVWQSIVYFAVSMTNDAGEESDEPSSPDSMPRSKVGRVIKKRNLEGLGEEMEQYWTGKGDKQRSLRELADLFNQRVLQSAMEATNEDVLVGETGNLYELLTGDDVTSGTRIEAENRLERVGIDVEQLRDEFVSHQAIHTYLTKYRGVKPPTGDTGSKLEKSRTTIQQLSNRLRAVTETSLETLRNADELTLGDYRIYVDVRVLCTDCEAQYSLLELFDSGGCDCDI